MAKTIAVIATLDTKGAECAYLREQIEALGSRALLIDIGVVGEPATPADVSREEIAAAGGTELTTLLENPTRQVAVPVMIAGATRCLQDRVGEGKIDGVIGLGGTQGTSTCAAIMQTLPYGLPKILVSTMASGDTSAFVGIKDITMMFSVSDILGLNPLTRKILANAAGAAHGMAQSSVTLQAGGGDRPAIGMTNLGVLTAGGMKAIELFEQAGYETIVFHAVGSGGQAMEQMMREGIIGAVFDYALGEVSDEVHGGFRAASPERLTVAGELGLPQVYCPGGTEHIGLFVEADQVPDAYQDHKYVFHNPIIFVPRLDGAEMEKVAEEIASRLAKHPSEAAFLLPTRGTSRYSVKGGPLHDPESDRAFFETLKAQLPSHVTTFEVDAAAEDDVFVELAVQQLIAQIEDA